MNRKQKKIKILIKVIKSHFRQDNKGNAKSIISYNIYFDNPMKIENFNFSENSSKNDNKVIQQDSFEIISITNSLKSKRK